MPLPGSTRHCLTSTVVPIMTEAPPAPPLPRTQRPSSFPPEVLRPHYTHIAPTLTLWPLAVLTFYNLSGFPSGIEPSICATGNFYHILGFLLFPLVWTLPDAAIMAEMGAAFRDHSAGAAWVEECFGEAWGAVCVYLIWVSVATDNTFKPPCSWSTSQALLGGWEPLPGGFFC
mmetsp:Transcript_6595/g.13415  ORF Transcript_6595/g.13415 Transcript_6595/m.13415 type:complete len:173 (+) Transcript_6595:182-700(+)